MPKQKRYASNGQIITFIDVGNDTGIGKTDNDWLAQELDTMIAEQRGGVFRSTQAEYDELKKNPSSATPWREELGKRGPEVNHKPVLQTLAPLPNPGEEPVAEDDEPVAPPAPPPLPPKASKRK